ncbi:Pancreatic triacylglycerol lipase-like protein [Dinothrombium tinctorium]|uniref:Pancreatic triacylglycerol lipase-like protein n=1 Tax=Dinothrombium tinctorium TaxID=1965070 RepID=A0A443RG62_9ACAR|nr:Pancreatic triacylglycerol lipase-like protein [Dinothrombium tinctorium]
MIIIVRLILLANVVFAANETDLEVSESGLKVQSNKPPKTCEGELGCFPVNDLFADPVVRPISQTPSHRDQVKTRILLYTQENNNIKQPYQVFAWNLPNYQLSPFNPLLPSKFVIPGYLDGRLTAAWTVEMVAAFLQFTNYNIFLIEWRNITPYGVAVSDTRVVGSEIANYINFLISHAKVRPESFHLIGHSLGAHIAAYAGQNVPNLGRITGLDPARPNFQNLMRDAVLTSDDANFVDVIHSDFNPINAVGFTDSIGHVDFYLNGASPQPGCFLQDRLFRGFVDGLRLGPVPLVTQTVRYNTLCSHQRSHELFLESIIFREHGCQFVALKCRDYEAFANAECSCDDEPNACAVLGLNADRYFQHEFKELARESGRWFLRTASKRPYCLYQYQIVIQLGYHKLPFLKGKMHLKIHYFLNGKVGLIELRISPPKALLTSALRMPYVVTLENSLGDIHHISFAWYSEQFEYMYARHYFRIPLKYIKISPITAMQPAGSLPVTKYFCHNLTPIKSLKFITLKASHSCLNSEAI